MQKINSIGNRQAVPMTGTGPSKPIPHANSNRSSSKQRLALIQKKPNSIDNASAAPIIVKPTIPTTSTLIARTNEQLSVTRKRPTNAPKPAVHAKRQRVEGSHRSAMIEKMRILRKRERRPVELTNAVCSNRVYRTTGMVHVFFCPHESCEYVFDNISAFHSHAVYVEHRNTRNEQTIEPEPAIITFKNNSLGLFACPLCGDFVEHSGLKHMMQHFNKRTDQKNHTGRLFRRNQVAAYGDYNSIGTIISDGS